MKFMHSTSLPEKVEQLNNGKSPIVDSVITDFLEKSTLGERILDFHATLDPQEAYRDADFAVNRHADKL